MSRPIRVYVSATADLEAEREVVGEALAKFPLPLPWEIRRTPHAGDQRPEALAGIGDSDFCLVMLGQDITAPLGAELEAALAANVPLLALQKDVPNTPAGRFFRYNSVERWQRFRMPADLGPLVVRFLAGNLSRNPVRYALTPEELSVLLEHLRKWGKDKEEQAPVTGKGPAGAEDAAVIVSPGRR